MSGRVQNTPPHTRGCSVFYIFYCATFPVTLADTRLTRACMLHACMLHACTQCSRTACMHAHLVFAASVRRVGLSMQCDERPTEYPHSTHNTHNSQHTQLTTYTTHNTQHREYIPQRTQNMQHTTQNAPCRTHTTLKILIEHAQYP